ncbi:MAG: hypothetical protein H6721_25740 [Sandaracinus sp.]|nr:hypothetical protein [Sandaracinus sp.]
MNEMGLQDRSGGSRALVAWFALALAACTPSGDGAAGPTGDAGVFEGPCTTEDDVRAVVFERSCTSSACHDARRPKAGLDLETPGAMERMLGVFSVHEACADRLLLVPGEPASSFFLDKLLGREGECGDPMPDLGALEPAQRRCVAEWIATMPTE